METSSQPARSRWRWDYAWLILLLVSLGLGSMALFRAQAVEQTLFGHDAALFYDGGWRVYNGIKPHVDFYSPLGPLDYLYVALGFVLFGLNVNSLAYLNALALPIVGGLTWLLLRNRIPPFWLFWASLLTGFCFVSAHHLRFDFSYLTYACVYNHQGYAGLLLLGFLLFAPEGKAGRLQLGINAFTAGAIVSLLFFLKITFFIAAVPLLLASWFLRSRADLSVALLLTGFALLTLLFLGYLDFAVGAMLHDLSIAARARSHHAGLIETVHEMKVMRAQVLAMLLLGIATHVRRIGLDLLFSFTAFLAAGLIAFASNAPDGHLDEIPLFAGFAILCTVRLQHDFFDPAAQLLRKEIGKKYFVLISLCGLIFVGIYLESDARSLWEAASLRSSHPVPPETFASDSMFLFEVDGLGGGFTHPDTYVTKINDGLALIRRAGLDHKTCSALEFTNPFPFALLSPPPRGGATFWQEKFNITPDSHPDADRVFRGVDILMIPKFPEEPSTTKLLLKIYGDYISIHYIPVAESKHWRLLKSDSLQ